MTRTTFLWICWLILAGAVLGLGVVTRLNAYAVTAVILAWFGGVVTALLAHNALKEKE